MKMTVEISLYPLTENYGHEVLDFIHLLKEIDESLIIRSNSMSTQVSGEFDAVMQTVTQALKKTFSKDTKAALVMKCFNEGLEIDWVNI